MAIAFLVATAAVAITELSRWARVDFHRVSRSFAYVVLNAEHGVRLALLVRGAEDFWNTRNQRQRFYEVDKNGNSED